MPYINVNLDWKKGSWKRGFVKDCEKGFVCLGEVRYGFYNLIMMMVQKERKKMK